MIVWKVEGLCIGGYGAGQSNGHGYVIWQRGYKGAEKDRFRWIRENPFIEFKRWILREYEGYDDSSGAPLGEDLTAVSWLDGDNSQLDTVVSEEGMKFRLEAFAQIESREDVRQRQEPPTHQEEASSSRLLGKAAEDSFASMRSREHRAGLGCVRSSGSNNSSGTRHPKHDRCM